MQNCISSLSFFYYLSFFFSLSLFLSLSLFILSLSVCLLNFINSLSFSLLYSKRLFFSYFLLCCRSLWVSYPLPFHCSSYTLNFSFYLSSSVFVFIFFSFFSSLCVYSSLLLSYLSLSSLFFCYLLSVLCSSLSDTRMYYALSENIVHIGNIYVYALTALMLRTLIKSLDISAYSACSIHCFLLLFFFLPLHKSFGIMFGCGSEYDLGYQKHTRTRNVICGKYSPSAELVLSSSTYRFLFLRFCVSFPLEAAFALRPIVFILVRRQLESSFILFRHFFFT